MKESLRIAIVGGGLSGTILALSLSRKLPSAQLVLIEKKPELLGRGIAYHHDFTHQPLNVPASGMSLYPEDTEHFFKWLIENHFRYNHLVQEVTPKTFVSRKVFGDYLQEELVKVHHKAAGHFQIRIDEVLSLDRNSDSFTVNLESGAKIEADHVVLALGNFPPGDIFSEDNTLNNDKRYFANPWTDRIYSRIQGSENILLVGTGLTAVDVVLGLHLRKFSGKITMLSRRGRLPLPHDLTHPPVELKYPGRLSPQQCFSWIKKEIKSRPEIPWTSVIDGLRPYTQNIWLSWDDAEKTFFLKRLRQYWEIARHRIPLSSHATLEKLLVDGKLEIGKASIVSGKSLPEGIEVTFSDANKNIRSQVFQEVINCTGPESNFRKVRFPIIEDLMSKGCVKSDFHGLGIACTADGKLVNASGNIEKGLWCIGPMRKAVLWETTALREIREQALAMTSAVD